MQKRRYSSFTAETSFETHEESDGVLDVDVDGIATCIRSGTRIGRKEVIPRNRAFAEGQGNFTCSDMMHVTGLFREQ